MWPFTKKTNPEAPRRRISTPTLCIRVHEGKLQQFFLVTEDDGGGGWVGIEGEFDPETYILPSGITSEWRDVPDSAIKAGQLPMQRFIDGRPERL